MWLASYITSATAITCGVFELGYHNENLSRLVKEQDDINRMENGDITYKQVDSKMPLLDSYIMEIIAGISLAESDMRHGDI